MKKIIALIMMGLINYGCKMPRSNAEIEADKIKISMDSIFNKTNSDDIIKIDSNKLKKLKLNFRTKKDEFSTDKVVFYYPKSAPSYTNRNGLYVYFGTKDDKAYNLRLTFQYYADDWLFIKSIQFLIDGKVYGYIPEEIKRDNEGGNIWEWFDESVDSSDRDLIIALSTAKNAKMKIIGDKYYKEKIVTSSQIRAFKETIELHKMLGGFL